VLGEIFEIFLGFHVTAEHEPHPAALQLIPQLELSQLPFSAINKLEVVNASQLVD
jgi:hypothetical protein